MPETLGGRIARMRKRAGMTQEGLATALDLSRKETVSDWERGAQDPGPDNLVAIARGLGVTVDYLLTGELVGDAAGGEALRRLEEVREIVSRPITTGRVSGEDADWVARMKEMVEELPTPDLPHGRTGGVQE